MQLTVKFFGFHDLRRLMPDTGGSSLLLCLPDKASLTDLLAALEERCGQEVTRRILTDTGELRGTVHVFVNGMQFNGPPSQPLCDGPDYPDCTVALILVSAIQGG